MAHRIAATALLVFLPFSAGAQDRRDEKESGPVHVAAMLGVVSLPRPIDAEVLVRIVDLFAVGIGYSDFPAFIANPLLELAGAKGGSTDARLDQFNAFDLDLRVFLFRGRFFVGSSFSTQSIMVGVSTNTTIGTALA